MGALLNGGVRLNCAAFEKELKMQKTQRFYGHSTDDVDRAITGWLFAGGKQILVRHPTQEQPAEMRASPQHHPIETAQRFYADVVYVEA